MNIRYDTCSLDETIFRLIKKLEPEYPADAVANEIAGKFATPCKVFFNEVLMGVLLLRGIKNYNGKMVLVIDHAIAEDKLDQSFSSVLEKSLFDYALTKGFSYVHQHADRPGLARMLQRVYGDPQEWIFKKDLSLWAKAHPVQKPVKQLPAQRLT